MKKSIKIVPITNKTNPDNFDLYVRTIEGRENISKRSLKITVTKKQFDSYFDNEVQRFKENQRFPKYNEYNNKIQEYLKELNKYGDDLQSIPDKQKSFIGYWESCIEDYTNHGTKLKHKIVLNKIKKYLTSLNKTDLFFEEINSVLIKKLRSHLLSVKDPKILSENTVNHYLKVMKSIINQSTSDDYYYYVKSPFVGIKFSSTSKRVKKQQVLTESETTLLINTPIKDVKLDSIRDYFLFQVFSNGMRVSDLFLLRWNNIQNNRINYVMFKTKTVMNIPININTGIILSKRLSGQLNYEDIVKQEKIMFVMEDEGNEIFEIGLKKLNKLILDIQITPVSYNKLVNKRIFENNKKLKRNVGELVDYKGYEIDQDNSKVKKLIDLRETLLTNIENRFLSELFERVNEEKIKNKNSFIFPFLPNVKYHDINDENDFSKISEEQYMMINKKTIVYDRNLKQLQKCLGIETVLTSHVSRHSFTNLLLRLKNVNLYDIQQSLGHSSIKITENYLTSHFNLEKLDYLNEQLTRQHRKKD